MESTSNAVENDTEDPYGPALPPHLVKGRDSTSTLDRSQITEGEEPKKKVIGPVIPSHLLQTIQNHDTPETSSHFSEAAQEEVAASPSEDDDDILDTVGPLPGKVNLDLEARALEIKLGHVSSSSGNQNNEKVRDEWMLELPEVRGVTDLGLTARQFRTKDRPDFSDRSQWTDTPEDKERKKHGKVSVRDVAKEEARERDRQAIANRDAEQEKIAKDLKKKHKRDKSLMELHDKKLKKAKKEKEKEGPEARRPFDRNVDLAANRFDEAQKKSIIKKAQLLDTRFSSGTSKFL